MDMQTQHTNFHQKAEVYLSSTTIEDPRTGEVYDTVLKDMSEEYAAYYQELIGAIDSFRDELGGFEEIENEPEYSGSDEDVGRDAEFERERPLVVEWPRDEDGVISWGEEAQGYRETQPEESPFGDERIFQDIDAEREISEPTEDEWLGVEDEATTGKGHLSGYNNFEGHPEIPQQRPKLKTAHTWDDLESESGRERLTPRRVSSSPSIDDAPADDGDSGGRIRETIIEYTIPHAPRPEPLSTPSVSPASPTDLYDPIRRISIPRPPRVDSLLPLLASGNSSPTASSVYSRGEETSEAVTSLSDGTVRYISTPVTMGSPTTDRKISQVKPALAAIEDDLKPSMDGPYAVQQEDHRASSLPDVRSEDEVTETKRLRPTSLPAYRVDEAQQMLALTGYVPQRSPSPEAPAKLPHPHLREDPLVPKRKPRRPRPVQLQRVSTHSLGKHADEIDEERYRRGSTSSSLVAFEAYNETMRNISAQHERPVSGIRSLQSFLSLHRRVERYIEGFQQQRTEDSMERMSYDNEEGLEERLMGTMPYDETVRGPTPTTDAATGSHGAGRHESNLMRRAMRRLSGKRPSSRFSTLSTPSSLTAPADTDSLLDRGAPSFASFKRLEAHRSPSSSNLHRAFADASPHNHAFRGLTTAEALDPSRVARRQQGIGSEYTPSLVSMEAPSLISRSGTPRNLAARLLNPNLRPTPSYSILSDSRPASAMSEPRIPASRFRRRGFEDEGEGSISDGDSIYNSRSSIRSTAPSLRSVSVGSSATARRPLVPVSGFSKHKVPVPSKKTRRYQSLPSSPGSADTARPSTDLPSYSSPEAPSYHTFDPLSPTGRIGVRQRQGGGKRGEWKSPTDRFVDWAVDGVKEGKRTLVRELGSAKGSDAGRRGRLEVVREEDEGSAGEGVR